jgi:hypothetical protein
VYARDSSLPAPPSLLITVGVKLKHDPINLLRRKTPKSKSAVSLDALAAVQVGPIVGRRRYRHVDRRPHPLPPAIGARLQVFSAVANDETAVDTPIWQHMRALMSAVYWRGEAGNNNDDDDGDDDDNDNDDEQGDGE